jgi:hypothetical protein
LGPGCPDVVDAGAGNDSVGEEGDDRILVRDGVRDVVTCGAGIDRVRADFAGDVAADCKQVNRHAPRPPAVRRSE